jgi:transposase InsO family protein
MPMPWIEVTAVNQRREFVALARVEGANISRLCERFGISRKTGYKWLGRRARATEKEDWAADRPRRPHECPWRCRPDIEQTVLDECAAHPAWRGRKIRALLIQHGCRPAPAASTIGAIVRRHGLVDLAESAKRAPMQRFERAAPNELWQMDFKGAVATAAGSCHPLTVIDDHSRFSVAVEACRDERAVSVRAALTKAMRLYGLPEVMLMDNGACWGRVESAWTVLEVWLIRLGVAVAHGRPYHPQTQGKCERFNRTLKAEALAGRNFHDLAACQRVFDQFRHEYNHVRPHEALAMATPASRYRVSVFAYPEALPPIEYVAGDIVRKVGPAGYISYRKGRYQVGRAFVGEPVALRATAQDGIWVVYYCHQRVATIDERNEACRQED